MQRSQTPPSLDTISTAERLLSAVFGAAVQLGVGDNLSSSKRADVYRLRVLVGPDSAPASVIVKQGQGIPEWPFYNDWASLQFLNEIAPEVPFAPCFYAGDRERGIFVMEDLGVGQRLDQLLLGSNPIAAENALVEHAAIHGRLHSVTSGKQAIYERIRRALGSPMGEDDYFTLDWLAPTLQQATELVGFVPASGVDQELATLVSSLQSPGPFLTFILGDSCPDNCLYNGSSLRLIDFEGGRFAHALLEGVYGRIHFPSCWCVYHLPEHIPQRMEAAYRAELVRGCPAAADDTLFYRAVVEACTFWVLDWLYATPLSRMLASDRHLIAASDRQRLLTRIAILVEATEQYRYMEAIGATMRAIATELRVRWPKTEEMEYYPAFR